MEVGQGPNWGCSAKEKIYQWKCSEILDGKYIKFSIRSKDEERHFLPERESIHNRFISCLYTTIMEVIM
jgi:hypothetical protein